MASSQYFHKKLYNTWLSLQISGPIFLSGLSKVFKLDFGRTHDLHSPTKFTSEFFAYFFGHIFLPFFLATFYAPFFGKSFGLFPYFFGMALLVFLFFFFWQGLVSLFFIFLASLFLVFFLVWKSTENVTANSENVPNWFCPLHILKSFSPELDPPVQVHRLIGFCEGFS